MYIEQIKAVDIPDAWFQCLWSILDNGFSYKIEHGSCVGETRYEFDFITIFIKIPYQEPYNMMLPKIPEHYNIPAPVEDGYIEQYLPYLMTAEKQTKEEYTYGERICGHEYTINKLLYDETASTIKNIKINQIDHWIKVLKETPNTNQAILQVAEPYDCLLDDPPCLRHIDMRIKNDRLIFYPYFRSWDLWGGFPANLAGIAVLQKYMADEIGVKSGEIIASSKGLHIYKYVKKLAKIRINKNEI